MNGAAPTFAEAMSRWHDFYMLAGGAAATLLGLLFVALSFGIGVEIEKRTEGINTFVTPTMVHFVDVLIIAAASVSPLARPVVAVLLVLMVVFNVVPGMHRIRHLRGFHQHEPFDWRDWLWYLLLPVGGQLLLVAAAIGMWRGDLRALEAMAGALALLLVCGIRNAWDLVIYLLEKR
jgi:hypothetical protein